MTDFMPKVSIIMPTYNKGNIIREAIEPILTQTFTDFELIIVNDGSTDNTGKVVKEYNDSRIRYFEKENRGPASARNLGLRHASGIYIGYCDDDDIYYPDHLEILSGYLDVNLDIGLVYADSLWIREDKEPFAVPLMEFDKQELERNNFITILSVLHRKECIEKAGLFDENIVVADLEDWDLWLRISDFYKFAYVKKVLGELRINENDHCRYYEYIINKRLDYLWQRYKDGILERLGDGYCLHVIQNLIDFGNMEGAFRIAKKLFGIRETFQSSFALGYCYFKKKDFKRSVALLEKAKRKITPDVNRENIKKLDLICLAAAEGVKI